MANKDNGIDLRCSTNDHSNKTIIQAKHYIISGYNQLFHPFIKKPADIYGNNDLNNLLRKFPEIEKQHYKLWLSSINVLEQILKLLLRGNQYGR
jgi:hypothetical protein